MAQAVVQRHTAHWENFVQDLPNAIFNVELVRQLYVMVFLMEELSVFVHTGD